MKKLVLIRHAKSSWKDDRMKDFDRPLNDRGKTDAPLMGKVLAKQGAQCDLYLSSPAKRAITTARAISEELGLSRDQLRTINDLYLADADTIMEVIANEGGNADTIFVTGHNPGFTELANRLSEARIDNLPTCGIFAVELDMAQWPEITGKQGRFLFFDYPKNHK